jgi:hypothetical protein
MVFSIFSPSPVCTGVVGKCRLSENYIAETAFAVSLAGGRKERRNECTVLCIF